MICLKCEILSFMLSRKSKLDALPVFDDKYIKTKIRTCGRVYTNFLGLNVLEDGVECEYFTVIFIDSLLVYDSKYYLRVYLDNSAYKIVNTQMIDYLDDNFFLRLMKISF